jgi:hypothetical protein
MTAKEWLSVMEKAADYNPLMTRLIIKYGEMLVAEQIEKKTDEFDNLLARFFAHENGVNSPSIIFEARDIQSAIYQENRIKNDFFTAQIMANEAVIKFFRNHIKGVNE